MFDSSSVFSTADVSLEGLPDWNKTTSTELEFAREITDALRQASNRSSQVMTTHGVRDKPPLQFSGRSSNSTALEPFEHNDSTTNDSLSNSFQLRDAVINSLIQRGVAECDSDNVQALRMPTHWMYDYSLADVVTGKIFGEGNVIGEESVIRLCGNATSKGTLPDSIICAFRSESAKDGEPVFDRLFRVIQRFNSSVNPPKQALVIHLRLGDVVDDSQDSLYNMLERQTFFYDYAPGEAWNGYVKPLNHFKELQKQLSPEQDIILMASAHAPNASYPLKSCQYLHAVANFFRDHNHGVTLRTGCTPDEDLLFVTGSSFFAPSGGGFSWFLGKVAEASGSTLLLTEHVNFPPDPP